MNLKVVVVITISLIFAGMPNYIYADQNDIELAKKFISDLPPACKGSRYSVSYDGTVIIRILCIGPSPDKSVDGEVQIKDGIVKKIR
jgi:hypothetical protein